MDSLQQGIAVQVAAGRDETLGQKDGILFVEGEVAVSLTVVIGYDIVGFAIDMDGVSGPFHINRYRTACIQVIDKSHLELLWPDDATMIGVILCYNEIAIFVGRVDSGHAFLFYP